jgi:Ser/Thr protein kinase RdoA (MazF antagonist)
VNHTDTQFFYSLTPERILEAVESLGVRTTGRALALNSMENRVYEVEIEVPDPDAVQSRHELFRVVKFYRPGRWSKEQVLEEHTFLRDAQEAELPVVAPLVLANGETVGVVPESEILFAIFPKVGGRIEDELQTPALERIGRLLARLHSVGAQHAAVSRLTLSPNTYGLENLTFLLNGTFIPTGFRSRLEQLVVRICDVSTPWFAATPIQRIHGDLHVGNILWNASGCMLVDFDDMVMGPCVQDLWLLVPGRDPESRANRDDLLAGYEQMRAFDRDSLRLVEPLRALRMVHFSAWIARRWEDPSFKRIFVDFGSERYWQDQISGLMEVVEILDYGG